MLLRLSQRADEVPHRRSRGDDELDRGVRGLFDHRSRTRVGQRDLERAAVEGAEQQEMCGFVLRGVAFERAFPGGDGELLLGGDDLGVEMSPSLLLNNGTRVCCSACLAVRAIRGQDVIGVGDCDDASLYGNRTTTETVWVATSVHPLVVIEHSQQLARVNLQVAQQSGWRKFVGMSTALNITLDRRGDELTVEIGAGQWLDKAAVGAVSLLVLWPLAVTAAIGAWNPMKMPERVFGHISDLLSRQSRPAPAAAGLPANVIAQLRELATLRDQGILTDEEFQAQKARLLGK